MTKQEAENIISTASIEWISSNIHPFVQRTFKDTDADYFRKMLNYLLVTGIKPEE